MGVEFSKSSRSNCRICDTRIIKGELRYYKIQDTGYDFATTWYYHIRCVALVSPKIIKAELKENYPEEIIVLLKKSLKLGNVKINALTKTETFDWKSIVKSRSQWVNSKKIAAVKSNFHASEILNSIIERKAIFELYNFLKNEIFKIKQKELLIIFSSIFDETWNFPTETITNKFPYGWNKDAKIPALIVNLLCNCSLKEEDTTNFLPFYKKVLLEFSKRKYTQSYSNKKNIEHDLELKLLHEIIVNDINKDTKFIKQFSSLLIERIFSFKENTTYDIKRSTDVSYFSSNNISELSSNFGYLSSYCSNNNYADFLKDLYTLNQLLVLLPQNDLNELLAAVNEEIELQYSGLTYFKIKSFMSFVFDDRESQIKLKEQLISVYNFLNEKKKVPSIINNTFISAFYEKSESALLDNIKNLVNVTLISIFAAFPEEAHSLFGDIYSYEEEITNKIRDTINNYLTIEENLSEKGKKSRKIYVEEVNKLEQGTIKEHLIKQAGNLFINKEVSCYYGNKSIGKVIYTKFYKSLTPAVILQFSDGSKLDILSFSWSPTVDTLPPDGIENVILEKGNNDENRRLILIFKDKIVPLFGYPQISWALSKIPYLKIQIVKDDFFKI
ncbi:MAG: hypothetical protein K9W46_12200 [Candidatus Heimdallarchaeum endolithica]|uniref:PARP-type domain-containing protein n=1 Tax=Candidatus Heimdallarchaeum endolithica TaxID=2876572 RepID=A0A9Y1FMW2_9ARCH|nr:MAG: hypothetical protein K9W46_12200 [Candidatus Heimdallarchaeum endolithica]